MVLPGHRHDDGGKILVRSRFVPAGGGLRSAECYLFYVFGHMFLVVVFVGCMPSFNSTSIPGLLDASRISLFI